MSSVSDALFLQGYNSDSMAGPSVMSNILKGGHDSQSVVFHEKLSIYQVHIVCFSEARLSMYR